MTKTKIALFAIPIIVVLVASGAVSGTFSEKESVILETPVELQNNVIPQAFGEKPNFVILNGTDLVSQQFLDNHNFTLGDVQCKIKMADTVANSEVMWCQFAGEIDKEGVFDVISQMAAEEIIGFFLFILEEGAGSEMFIGLAIMEFLNEEIESTTGLDLSNPDGSEMEFYSSFENLNSEDEATTNLSWKIKEMWG